MKKSPTLLAVVAVLSLAGCSSVEDRVKNYMLQEAGILDDINYQEYQQYAEKDLLDADGYFVDPVEETPPVLGTIHVTFASNNNLQVHYYIDDEHKKPLDTSGCYLEPGDTVYAEATVAEDVLIDLSFCIVLKCAVSFHIVKSESLYLQGFPAFLRVYRVVSFHKVCSVVFRNLLGFCWVSCSTPSCPCSG